MKQRITAAELKGMTMKELAAWVEFNACAINRTMVMSWGHEELFKEYHIRPDYIGWKAGRLIVKAFHFTSRTRKADAQSFAEWLHWAIFGEYPAEETTETAEQIEETETETAAPSAPSANEETAAPAEEQTTTTNEEEAEIMTRKELYTAITAAGVALHPCNAADTAPEDDTAVYYLTTEELTAIYADITEEQTTETTNTTDTEEEEEEQTMNTKKHMTKSEAIREIATLSSSTLARICGSTNYSMIDDCCNRLILAASSMKKDAFCDCENWIDVLHTINASTDNDIDSPYLLGNMDYREYLNKYGHDEAVTILRSYIETITSEGIQNTKWERDYIRGAKDALCIA